MTKNKILFWTIIKAIMAIFMLYGGIQHFVATAFYWPFVPGFLPFKMAIIYISGFLEIAVGILLLFKKSQGVAAMALLVLMLVFLPIHIWDVFSETPAIGSTQAALVRLPVQLLFIAISWKLKKIYFT